MLKTNQAFSMHKKWCGKKKKKPGPGKGWSKGRTFDQIYRERSNEIKSKISRKLVGRPFKISEDKNKIRKAKLSEKMKKFGGYRRNSGRGKQGYYKSIFFQSSYELAWIIYAIDKKIKFERNNKGFEYTFKGDTKKFYPDFYIEKDDSYIEVKGYFTQQTQEKIKQFPKKLVVINSEKIKPFLEYAITKFGKDFAKQFSRKG
jgi:hypothetical protein